MLSAYVLIESELGKVALNHHACSNVAPATLDGRAEEPSRTASTIGRRVAVS
jgi:hypothetical protein